MTFYGVLFALPMPHGFLVFLFVAAASFSTFWVIRNGGLDLFHFAPVTSSFSQGGDTGKSLRQSLMVALLALLPIAYTLALAAQWVELQSFSIRWPASVYLDALVWAAMSLPLILVLGVLLWRSSLQAHLRLILLFYAALTVVGLWTGIWAVLDEQVLEWLWGGIREPLLFDPWTEATYRHAVQVFYFTSGAFLAIGYLVLAQGGAAFLRRALFIGLPAGLAYAHMLFVLGDWNYYLGALQAALLREQYLVPYSWVAAGKTARVPEAFRTPYDLEELAEFHYQSGDTDGAMDQWRRIQTLVQNGNPARPYASDLGLRAEHYLGHLQQRSSPKSDSLHLGNNPSELPLRLIRPAAYLDADWYALLGAIGFLRPTWSDLEIKKRLLSVSSSLQMDLPAITGIPALRVILDKLGIAHRTGFADGQRLRQALARGLVPFIHLDGQWVSVSGYDAARDAYLYHRYPERFENNPWWGAPELDVLSVTKADSSSGRVAVRVPILRAMPAPELERNLHDIGGVAVFLGDSTWIQKPEEQAAFWVELGDTYYQEQDNDAAADSAYARAQGLWPNEYVLARQAYLKRRWQVRNQDPGDYAALFRMHKTPAWFKALDTAAENRIVTRILAGDMGQYLLYSWVPRIPPAGAENRQARLDSAEAIYRKLRAMEPGQALYLDSLAALAYRRKQHAQERLYLDTLSAYRPFGDEDIQFRLAWSAYLAGESQFAKVALDRCESYRHHPRYDLIAGALDCREGRRKQGRNKLERSLKQDKTEPRAHMEWRECQEPAEKQPAYLEIWERRTQ